MSQTEMRMIHLNYGGNVMISDNVYIIYILKKLWESVLRGVKEGIWI